MLSEVLCILNIQVAIEVVVFHVHFQASNVCENLWYTFLLVLVDNGVSAWNTETTGSPHPLIKDKHEKDPGSGYYCMKEIAAMPPVQISEYTMGGHQGSWPTRHSNSAATGQPVKLFVPFPSGTLILVPGSVAEIQKVYSIGTKLLSVVWRIFHVRDKFRSLSSHTSGLWRRQK